MSREGSSYTTIIEASTAEELRMKVLNLAAVMGGVAPTSVADVPPQPSEAPKRAKKKEAATEEKAPEAAVTVDPFADDEETTEAEPEEKKLTFDDIKKSAQAFVEKHGEPKVGLPKLTELLAKFEDKAGKPVTKVTALREKDYAAFAAAAK